MKHWGVHLGLSNCPPTTHTPMIVQETQVRTRRPLRPPILVVLPSLRHMVAALQGDHRSEQWREVKPTLAGASVFFLDRLSRGTLTLAAEASACGALVVFEPSSMSTDKLMAEALALAHVVKYADRRLAGIDAAMANVSAVLLEVQTLGDKGLKYRHRLRRDVSRWMHLDAVPTPRVVDTCGAGDWCTAGLIAKAGFRGQRGFRDVGARGVRAALRYGQVLAAWIVGLKCARRYVRRFPTSVPETDHQFGQRSIRHHPGCSGGSTPTPSVPCPACPPAPLVRRQATTRAYGGLMM